MFFDNNSFRLMEDGVKLTWQQQQLHLQNMANIETPGYKAKSMAFEQVLATEQGARLQAKVITSDSAARPDGNNVDADTESVELYKAYAQYSLLLDKIKGQFTNYNYVLNSNMK